MGCSLTLPADYAKAVFIRAVVFLATRLSPVNYTSIYLKRMHKPIYTHAHAHAHTHAHTHTLTRTRTRPHAHAHAHTHTHTRACTHTHARTHTDLCHHALLAAITHSIEHDLSLLLHSAGLICSPPCPNGGVCVLGKNNKNTCDCPTGFTGTNCGTIKRRRLYL
jgi:hypothetical protein